MSSTPTPTPEAPVCERDGGELVSAFAPVETSYVRCRRCGNVFSSVEVVAGGEV